MNVLLVEDDPGIGRFVTRGLTARGYDVTWQRDGTHVPAMLRGGGYAAALLDLGLPDVDGLDLCRDLRRDGVATPILMLTARAALQDRLDGFAVGADDYLPKPFAFDELLARLGVLIRRGGDAKPAPLRFAALQLDPGTKTARVGDRSLPLSRREFDLLAALVAGGGSVVSRDALSNAVWGAETNVTDNALDVYIGYLRRGLAAITDAPAIETLRGRGYRMSQPD